MQNAKHRSSRATIDVLGDGNTDLNATRLWKLAGLVWLDAGIATRSVFQTPASCSPIGGGWSHRFQISNPAAACWRGAQSATEKL